MCRCRSSLIGGAKKGHGKIFRLNPIGKHIQVLQQNPPNTGHEGGRSARRFRGTSAHRRLVAPITKVQCQVDGRQSGLGNLRARG